MQRVAIVLNPVSGSSAKERALRTFRETLEQGGCEVRLVPTQTAGQAPRLAREAADAGADVVVAAGGDGTINDVATGLLALGSGAPPLALLPRGTSNLVARELGIPFDAAGAARVVLEGAPRSLDVVAIGDRTLVACAGVGWDAHVVRSLTAKRKGHIGVTTWFGPIASALRDYTFPVFRVAWDAAPNGTPAGAEECVLALVLNCRPYAKFFVPAPDARPDDGLLDVVVVRPDGRRHLPRIAWRAWRQTLAGDPAVRIVRAAAFRVTSAEPVPWQVDGDVGGTTPVDMLVRPGVLRVLAPRAKELR